MRASEKEPRRVITEDRGQKSKNREDKRKHIRCQIRLLGCTQFFSASCVVPEANMKGKKIL